MKLQNYQYPSFEQLRNGMTTVGEYSHLRLILIKNANRQLGQRYVLLEPNDFKIIQLLDVDYENGLIMLIIKDTANGKVSNINHNVLNKHPKFSLICLEDILNSAKTDYANMLNNNDLLDFDY